MSKSNLLKVFFSLVLSIVLILMVTTVNAADSNGFNDITPQLTNNNAGNNTANTNTGSGSTNTNRANTGSTNTNRANTSANRSSNTNLPKTGLSDSLPVVLLVVVFGISAVYAYKKIKDYRNI